MSEPRCSCGKPFDDHLGVMALCAENQELRSTSHKAVADIVLQWPTVELVGLYQSIRETLERRARHAVEVTRSKGKTRAKPLRRGRS
jgi:hypothetical protein